MKLRDMGLEALAHIDTMIGFGVDRPATMIGPTQFEHLRAAQIALYQAMQIRFPDDDTDDHAA